MLDSDCSTQLQAKLDRVGKFAKDWMVSADGFRNGVADLLYRPRIPCSVLCAARDTVLEAERGTDSLLILQGNLL